MVCRIRRLVAASVPLGSLGRRFLFFTPGLIAVALVITGAFAPVAAIAQSELEERLRGRVEAGLTTESFDVMDERLHARETMRRIYPARAFRPFWIGDDGLLPHSRIFIEWLATGPLRQGLRPEHYHLDAIESLELDRIGALVDIELALSDAFLIVGSHFLTGRLDPETLDSEWVATRRERDLGEWLSRVGPDTVAGDLLEELLPNQSAYYALASELAALRRIRDDGGWPRIGDGPTLRPGDSGERVAELATRLLASGDLETGPAASGTAFDGSVFDESLEVAVRRFQSRHGLSADGVVGRNTLAALNVPVQERINQIVVNLERWRWLPENLGDRYIIVNIAGFRLDVVENGESVMDMRVVVGRPFRRTPVFSETIRYLVLNPSWEVPTRIATQDKLPLIKSDPSYISSQGFRLLQGWGADERVIDPLSVDWSAVTARNFDYRLRQMPGPLNALGQVKFMFPNKFSVYLHDTPSRELFGEDVRAFSSGCIRLSQPIELAALLLGDDPGWSREAIDRVLADGRERNVTLPRAMPVHLLYWTAWVDDDGVLQFRDDIYDRDQPVLRELREDPPT